MKALRIPIAIALALAGPAPLDAATATGSVDPSRPGQVAAAIAGARSYTYLTLERTSTVSGEPVTLTAQVDGASPTGAVVFRDGGDAIEGCAAVPLEGPYPPRAQCIATWATGGFRTLTAHYAGDANNDPSSSSEATLFVNQRPIIGGPVEITLFEDDRLDQVPILVSDPDSGVNLSSLRVASDDQALLADATLTPYNWQGQTYFRLRPAPGRSGAAVVTISVADVYGAVAMRDVPVTVLSVNDPPEISARRTVLHPAGSSGPADPLVVTVNTLGAGEDGQSATSTLEVAHDPAGVVASLVGNRRYVLSGNPGLARLRVTVIDDGGRENGGNDTASREISVVVADGNNLVALVSDRPPPILQPGPPEQRTVDGFVLNQGPGDVRDVTISLESTGFEAITVVWDCSFAGCPSGSDAPPVRFTLATVPSGGILKATVYGFSGPDLNRLRVSVRSSDPAVIHPDDDTAEILWTQVGGAYDFLSVSGFEPR